MSSSVFAGRPNIVNVCDTLKGDFQIVCYNGMTGILRCHDYPGDLEIACYNEALNPDNGNFYYTSIKPICDELKGDLKIACNNGVMGVITCDDYPGDFQVACYYGVLNPNNGKHYKLKN